MQLDMPRNKRRGRPAGLKNKTKFGGSAAKMDVAQLSSYIASLRNTLGAKVEQQREYFERQLAALGIHSNGRSGSRTSSARALPRRVPAGERSRSQSISRRKIRN